MITPELLDFIEAELKAGQSTAGLARLLREGGGWTDEDVADALGALEKRRNPVSIAQMRAHSVTPPITPLIQPAPIVHTPAPKPAPSPALPVGEVFSTSKEVINNETTPVSAPEPVLAPKKDEVVKPIHEISLAETWKEIAPPPLPLAQKTDSALHTEEILMPGLPAKVAPAHMPLSMSSAVSTSPIAPQVVPVGEGPVALSGPTSSGSSLRSAPSSLKKVLVALGGFLLLGLLGTGGYMLFAGLTPKADKVFATMYASIPGIQSLRYSGETTMNFMGEVADPLKAGFPLGYTGSAKVALKYDGRADLTKGIDGVHQFGITADLRSGEAALSVNSSIELRIIGDTYYMKITNPPEIKDVDLSRLDTYWIAVSPSDIAQRFGGLPLEAKEGYGSFGGASSTPTFRGLLASKPPFTSVDRVGEEQVGGMQTIHYRFIGNPENILELMRSLVLSITGSPWEMSAEEDVNMKALLENVAGDIWIDSATFLPRKIVFRQPLQGMVSGIALDGTLDVEQNYSEYNGQVSVSTPRPVITYAEFADDVKRQSERAKATGDARRVFDAGDIVSALEVYRANNDDRYPLTLDALVEEGLLPSLPADPDGGIYLYAPFIAEGKTTKKSLCTVASATCTYFHLGVTLSDQKWVALENDNDIVSEIISGTDTKGCAKEADKACYDLIPPPR